MSLLGRFRERVELLKDALDWPRQFTQAIFDVVYDYNYRIKVMRSRIDQLEARIENLETQ